MHVAPQLDEDTPSKYLALAGKPVSDYCYTTCLALTVEPEASSLAAKHVRCSGLSSTTGALSFRVKK